MHFQHNPGFVTIAFPLPQLEHSCIIELVFSNILELVRIQTVPHFERDLQNQFDTLILSSGLLF